MCFFEGGLCVQKSMSRVRCSLGGGSLTFKDHPVPSGIISSRKSGDGTFIHVLVTIAWSEDLAEFVILRLKRGTVTMLASAMRNIVEFRKCSWFRSKNVGFTAGRFDFILLLDLWVAVLGDVGEKSSTRALDSFSVYGFIWLYVAVSEDLIQRRSSRRCENLVKIMFFVCNEPVRSKG